MFLFNCVKLVNTSLMFDNDFRPVSDIEEFPLIIKNVGENIKKSIPQFTFTFLMYSVDANEDVEQITGEIFRIACSTTYFEENFKNILTALKDPSILKMAFIATLDSKELNTPVRALPLYPRDKSLFDLIVTVDPIGGHNFNLNLKFICDDSYNETEFLEAFKTDGELYGFARIAQWDGKDCFYPSTPLKISLECTNRKNFCH